jgi:C-terminal processing protease CtpA/Prc
MNRRELLLAGLIGSVLRAQADDPALFGQVFEAVWTAVRDQFYDPNTRGLDWVEIKRKFAPRVSACTSRQQLLTLLRDMLGRLHNSHIFLYSREEWDLSENILPFNFDRLGDRVFIRELLRPKTADDSTQFRFGDEIPSVDQLPPGRLHPYSLATLQEVKGNPNFGPAASVAVVNIRRAGKTSTFRTRRVMRKQDLQNALIAEPLDGIKVLRMLTLDSALLPEQQLREIWSSVQPSRGIVIDLRNCVGGDPKVSNFIAGGLLGEHKRLFTEIPRPGTQQPEAIEYSDSGVELYRGKVVVLTNTNTESQPEVLAAICKEYSGARLIGERTAGAFNGWTIAIPLPDHFARFALPYTREVSPKGISYEGRGIVPDEVISSTVEDYASGSDRVLKRALELLR